MGEKRRLELRIPKVLHGKLKDKASYQGMTINSICLEILWKHFERSEKTKTETG